MTPTWSETATFADYVLPMGHSTERHDTHSYETHAARWLGFRQPVRRVAFEKLGKEFLDTRDTNPGEVWEENEFWFALSWRIDPDGSLGIRRYFESPYRPGEPVTVDEYYRWVFENRVPGLPEKAAAEGLSALAYMRRYGVVEIANDLYRQDERPLTADELDGAVADETGVLRKPTDDESTPPLVGEAGSVGVELADGSRVAGWLTPSRKLELYSDTAASFGWPEQATPGLHPLARGRLRDRQRGRRDGPGPHLPAADPDPHPVGKRQVPQRDQQHAPAVDERRRRASQGTGHRRRWCASPPGSVTSSPGCGRPRASAPAWSRSAITWVDGGCTTTTAAGG